MILGQSEVMPKRLIAQQYMIGFVSRHTSCKQRYNIVRGCTCGTWRTKEHRSQKAVDASSNNCTPLATTVESFAPSSNLHYPNFTPAKGQGSKVKALCGSLVRSRWWRREWSRSLQLPLKRRPELINRLLRHSVHVTISKPLYHQCKKVQMS